MIRQEIIVRRPHAVVQHTSHVRRPQYFNTSVTNAFRNRWAYRGILSDQATYDTYLKECPFEAGNFVKLEHIQKVSNLINVHYVVKNMKDVKDVPFQFVNGHPKCFLLMSCAGVDPEAAPWMRWETPIDHIPITDEEYDLLVRPAYDHLQNRIKTYAEASPI